MVDTSVWVSYFRGDRETTKIADGVDYLIAGDEAVVNEAILAELVPFMRVRGEKSAEEALLAIKSPPMKINWNGIMEMQEKCLRTGIIKVGIPDLMIAQHAIQLEIPLFSQDRHFTLISKIFGLKLWPSPV